MNRKASIVQFLQKIMVKFYSCGKLAYGIFHCAFRHFAQQNKESVVQKVLTFCIICGSISTTKNERSEDEYDNQELRSRERASRRIPQREKA